VQGNAPIIAISILFLFLQLISVVVVYRFWEMILFNYDDNTWDNGGNLSSTSMGGTELESNIAASRPSGPGLAAASTSSTTLTMTANPAVAAATVATGATKSPVHTNP
jgi:hypothetical protein